MLKYIINNIKEVIKGNGVFDDNDVINIELSESVIWNPFFEEFIVVNNNDKETEPTKNINDLLKKIRGAGY